MAVTFAALTAAAWGVSSAPAPAVASSVTSTAGDAPDKNGYLLTPDPYDKELWSRATGKIYRTGFGAVTCSGSVIRSKHRNLVLTAPHRVYDQAKKQWKGDDDFVFVPARGMDPKARDKPVNWEKYGA
ncbi:hypothetical protein [Streptomyces acidicola]|uniref:hypothetical protein n=1 Tax=Streptomyces acidicola TaxID=2596892 RepID=UPI00342C100F